MAETFTVNEIAAMKMCLNYDDRESQHGDNHSDCGPEDIAKSFGWNMHQAGGLIASLSNKEVAWLDDREGEPWHNDPTMHVLYLTEKGVNAIFDIIEKETA